MTSATTTTARALFLATIASMSLAACVGGDGNGSVFQHFSIQDDGVVVVHSQTDSDAIVASNGDLIINNKPIAVTSAQRQLLQDYRRHVLDLRSDAVATGKEGGRTAIRAIGAAVEGLGSGHPDAINEKVKRQTSQVEALANKVCLNLADVRASQEAIVAEIPAFKPYATIEVQQIKDCGAK